MAWISPGAMQTYLCRGVILKQCWGGLRVLLIILSPPSPLIVGTLDKREYMLLSGTQLFKEGGLLLLSRGLSASYLQSSCPKVLRCHSWAPVEAAPVSCSTKSYLTLWDLLSASCCTCRLAVATSPSPQLHPPRRRLPTLPQALPHHLAWTPLNRLRLPHPCLHPANISLSRTAPPSADRRP